MADLEQAKQFASHAHRTQRYAEEPYTVHLAAVELVLRTFAQPDEPEPEMLQAAWLHDTLEDTGTTPESLEALFGARVLALVFAVTQVPHALRHERVHSTYPKIRATPGAAQLKLADRISNVERSVQSADSRHLETYRAEQPEFESHVRVPGEHDAMWDYLNVLLASGP